MKKAFQFHSPLHCLWSGGKYFVTDASSSLVVGLSFSFCFQLRQSKLSLDHKWKHCYFHRIITLYPFWSCTGIAHFNQTYLNCIIMPYQQWSNYPTSFPCAFYHWKRNVHFDWENYYHFHFVMMKAHSAALSHFFSSLLIVVLPYYFHNGVSSKSCFRECVLTIN